MVSQSIERPTPLTDAVERLGQSGEGLSIDVAATKETGAVVSVEATKQAGNWTVSGAWQYAKKTGHAVLGKIRWTPALLFALVLAACAKPPAREPHRQQTHTLPLNVRNSDLICAQTIRDPEALCRTVGEFRIWLASRAAAP